MKASGKPVPGSVRSLDLLPRWIIKGRGEDVDAVAFSSGAALAMLGVMMRDPPGTLPADLLRDRMALEAAQACLKLEGRSESVSDIRDAACLAQAGDAHGPAGDMFFAWRKVIRVNLAASLWADALTQHLPDQVAKVMLDLDVAELSPAARVARVLAGTLQQFPRQEAAVLMLADVTLARAVGWDRAMPLMAAHLRRADVRRIADGATDPVPCVHRAMIAACDRVIRYGADLRRRSARLNAVLPQLRAKGAREAVALFLSHDAVSPSGMLSPVITGSSFAMTDRAARRLCDRLVGLGVVSELTGRSTFRLYGL